MTERLGSPPGPGSNVKGRAAGAAWTYLLDELTAPMVVCIGEPSPAAQVTLRRVSDRLAVIGGTGGARTDGASRVTAADLSDGSADLLYLVEDSAQGIDHAMRLMAPQGVLYVETRAGDAEETLRRRISAHGGHLRGRYSMSPTRGEARTAVPAADAVVLRYFVESGLIVHDLHPIFRRVERSLIHRRPVRGRMGLMVSRNAPQAAGSSVPRYLVRLASEHGLDLRGYRYGLSARGQYNSRKVIFFLFPPGAETPSMVVKTTRDAAFNDRLVNEESALRELASRDLVQHGTVPEVVFSGQHGGLRILGETVLDGPSMRSDPGSLEPAYQWITDLAANSAEHGPAASHRVEERLGSLAEQLVERYALDEGQSRAIQTLVDDVREHSAQMPLVFSHGDAATWNAVRLVDGRIGFLDWEAGRPDGIPLWDLWYFARSRVMSASRVRRRLGLRGPNVVTALRRDPALARVVDGYVARLQIPAKALRPLFTLCWADRALREVTRLDARGLAHGHYIGLVRQLLAEGAGPVSGQGRESL